MIALALAVESLASNGDYGNLQMGGMKMLTTAVSVGMIGGLTGVIPSLHPGGQYEGGEGKMNIEDIEEHLEELAQSPYAEEEMSIAIIRQLLDIIDRSKAEFSCRDMKMNGKCLWVISIEGQQRVYKILSELVI